MESEEAKKKFLMKVGIISIMALIFVFWVLNIKNVFRSEDNGTTDNSLAQLKNIQNDFSANFDQINKDINSAISSTTATTTATVTATTPATTTSNNVASSSLVNELIKTTNKIASSSVETKAGCPAFINCMPTIGAARNCSIPVGCEGITQIAY
jgi:myo-inositol-1-phosphate synthase